MIRSILPLAMFLCIATFLLQGQQAYETEEFHSIELKGNLEAVLTQDDQHSVTAYVSDKMAEFLTIEVKHGVLTVSTAENNDRKPPKSEETVEVHISFPQLQSLSVSGVVEVTGGPLALNDLRLNVSGAAELTLPLTCPYLDLHVSGAAEAELQVETGRISLHASGASEVTLRGSARTMEVVNSGSSEVESGELQTGGMTVRASGSASLKAWVEGDLTVSASGSSDVLYHCANCGTLNVSTSGAASVKKY